MRWPAIIREVKAAIEMDEDGVRVLNDGEAAYLEGSRRYEVPSLDILNVNRGKEELTEPLLLQFTGHGATLQDVIDIGTMLERLFDFDTWRDVGEIYMHTTRIDDGPLEGPDKHGRFHQSWDYMFDAPRSKYVRETMES